MGKLVAFINVVLEYGEPMLQDETKLGLVGFCYELGEFGQLVGDRFSLKCLH